MPVLAASTPMSVATATICRAHEVGASAARSACTPRVFWAVTATIADVPHTPWASNVLRSAAIPAPPPESDPAIGERDRGPRRHHVCSQPPSGRSPSPSRRSVGVGRAATDGQRQREPGGGERDLHARRVGRGEEQLVVLAPAERGIHAVVAHGPGHAHGHRHAVERDADARRVGEVAQVGRQPVGDVDHGGRTRGARRLALGHARARPAVGQRQVGRLAPPPGAQQLEARRESRGDR